MKSLWITFAIVSGGFTAMNAFAKQSAEDIYLGGPETWVAGSPAVVVGNATGLTTEVLKTMQGPARTPLVWTVTGRIDSVRAIKGTAPGAGVSFSRREASPFAMGEDADPPWVADYGLVRGGAVVAFMDPSNPGHAKLVVPSGTGELDLVALVARAAHVASLDGALARRRALLDWMHDAATDAERRATLRWLVKDAVPWQEFAAGVAPHWAAWSPQLHTYIAGLVTTGVRRGAWPVQDAQPVRFVCTIFLREQDAARQVQAVLPLKTLAAWATEDGERDSRAQAAQTLAQCMRERHAAGPMTESLRQHVDQIELGLGTR